MNLVLDLDHTLVHSVMAESMLKAFETDRGALRKMLEASVDLHQNVVTGAWIKVRPGARRMLRDLRQHYTMHVYTMGNRQYANEILKILDPSDSIFCRRVVTRCDAPDLACKQLTRLGLRNSNTYIVDDIPEVWAGSGEKSILQVEQYMYFPVKVGQRSPFTLYIDELPESNNLAHVQRALEKIHQLHSGTVSVDCAKALETIRKSVLTGCCILIDETIWPSERLRLAKIACDLGATCWSQGATGLVITHSVVERPVKSDVVLPSGCHTVTSQWLMYCYIFLRNVNVRNFVIAT